MISPKRKKLLWELTNKKCEECKKKFPLSKIEIHRIRPGNEDGTYEHRNCMVLCKKCHEIFTSAQRIANGVQER